MFDIRYAGRERALPKYDAEYDAKVKELLPRFTDYVTKFVDVLANWNIAADMDRDMGKVDLYPINSRFLSSYLYETTDLEAFCPASPDGWKTLVLSPLIIGHRGTVDVLLSLSSRGLEALELYPNRQVMTNNSATVFSHLGIECYDDVNAVAFDGVVKTFTLGDSSRFIMALPVVMKAINDPNKENTFSECRYALLYNLLNRKVMLLDFAQPGTALDLKNSGLMKHIINYSLNEKGKPVITLGDEQVIHLLDDFIDQAEKQCWVLSHPEMKNNELSFRGNEARSIITLPRFYISGVDFGESQGYEDLKVYLGYSDTHICLDMRNAGSLEKKITRKVKVFGFRYSGNVLNVINYATINSLSAASDMIMDNLDLTVDGDFTSMTFERLSNIRVATNLTRKIKIFYVDNIDLAVKNVNFGLDIHSANMIIGSISDCKDVNISGAGLASRDDESSRLSISSCDSVFLDTSRLGTMHLKDIKRVKLKDCTGLSDMFVHLDNVSTLVIYGTLRESFAYNFIYDRLDDNNQCRLDFDVESSCFGFRSAITNLSDLVVSSLIPGLGSGKVSTVDNSSISVKFSPECSKSGTIDLIIRFYVLNDLEWFLQGLLTTWSVEYLVARVLLTIQCEIPDNVALNVQFRVLGKHLDGLVSDCIINNDADLKRWHASLNFDKQDYCGTAMLDAIKNVRDAGHVKWNSLQIVHVPIKEGE